MRLFPLHDTNFLLTQWDIMYHKLCSRGRHCQPDLTEISAIQIHSQKKKYIGALSKSLLEKSYQPQSAHVRALYSKKWRNFYSICLTDQLLHMIFANLLYTCLEKHLLPNCYSFRKGKNHYEAVRHCSKFIQKHIKNSKIDLYVLRSDVSSYSDSIPVHNASPLWPSLKNLLLTYSEEKISDYQWAILIDLIRPLVIADNQSLKHNLIGIPTGTYLNNPILNLYLHPLDEYLSSISGGCYCRFGDDYVFMHPDSAVFLKAKQEAQRIIQSLSLETNVKKNKIYYLTIAGRSCESLEMKEKVSGTNSFLFLGCKIKATGIVSPSKIKTRIIIKHFQKILRATKSCLTVTSAIEITNMLCQTLNQQFIDLLDACFFEKNIFSFLRNCTDREFFKYLDRHLALSVAEIATGLTGKSAFSRISYYDIRHRFGLTSLCQLKNAGKL